MRLARVTCISQSPFTAKEQEIHGSSDRIIGLITLEEVPVQFAQLPASKTLNRILCK
jgi:hypothetical protein